MKEILEIKNKIWFSEIRNTKDNLKCKNDLFTQLLQNITFLQDKILLKISLLNFY